jgi:hypothetical protein
MGQHVLDYLRRHNYPHKDMLLTVYAYFDGLHEYLVRKPGGATLATCWAHRSYVADMCDMLISRSVVDLDKNLGKRWLLKKPCAELSFNYNEIFHQFDILRVRVGNTIKQRLVCAVLCGRFPYTVAAKVLGKLAKPKPRVYMHEFAIRPLT